ncbi:hypothetical protein R5R35_005469 [Gryllus longicercus]|uniref:Uncharacterized protein n=1 Tax=Gryllus longicercus TaxID=2509291 RepID=A0AAN9VXZ9_9ORTH
MNEDRDREDDPFRELWISNWEQQCVEQLESEPDYERQLQSERDLTNQKVWISFQNSATAVAQLYKDRLQGMSLWIPFQTAAGTEEWVIIPWIEMLTFITSWYEMCLH